MHFPVLQTKIIPEKNPKELIPREKLSALLKANEDKKLVAVISGAGYGKTTLIKDFLTGGSYDYCWYRLDENDDNLVKFLVYFIYSVRTVHKQFGSAALNLADSLVTIGSTKKSQETILSSIGTSIINDAVKYIQKDIYLVLDDFHLLPKEDWVNKIMNLLIENLPENFHLIITSRELLPFETGKLKAKRKYFEILSKNMKLSDEEIARVSTELYGLALEPGQASAINSRVGGWITGIHLFLQSNPERASQLPLEKSLPGALYEYFIQDIFSSLEKNIQDFLIKTCILDEFTLKTVEKLTGNKQPKKILDELLRRNIFIDKSEDAGAEKLTVYKYQELFRDFLRQRLEDSMSPVEKAEMLTRYAAYYSSAGDIINAVNFYLMAEDYEPAIDFIIKNIDETAKGGQLELADKWLKAIPEKIVQKNSLLLFYKGTHSLHISNKPQQAMVYFKDAISLFRKEENLRYEMRAYSFISEILIKSGKAEAAIEIINSNLKRAELPESKVNLLYWKAIAYYTLSDYDNSLTLLNEALDICNKHNIETNKYGILNHIGNIYLIKGNYTKALFYYETVARNIPNVYNKFETLLNIVQTLANAGELERAKKMLEEAETIKYSYPAAFFEINFLLTALELFFTAGDFERAVEISNELLINSLDKNLNYYIFLAYFTMGRCYYYLCDYKKAMEAFNYSSQYIDAENETDKIYYNFWNDIINKQLKLKKNMDSSFLEYIYFFKKKGLLFEEVYCRYHLADYYLRLGNNVKAAETLENSFGKSEKNEYYFKFKREVFLNRRLFDFAISQNIRTEFIKGVFESAFNYENFDWLSHDCRERMREETSVLYDISVYTFGVPEIKVRGKKVNDSLWLRKNRKFIFLYMFLNIKNNLTKDVLVDLFYPDSNPENADNNFYQLMSNIRAVLKSAKEEGGDEYKLPEFIQYSDKKVQADSNYYYYSDAAEFDEIYRKVFNDKLPEAKKTALLQSAFNIYKGEFLENCYDQWCEDLRAKYSGMHIDLLREMIEIQKKERNYEAVIKYAEEIVKRDNLDEDAYIEILESEKNLGNALKLNLRIKSIYNIYKKELKEAPSEKILEKIKQLGL